MTLCHDVPVLPALIHPSHDMRLNRVNWSAACEQCGAYACPQCGRDEAEEEALAAECPGRGWWDVPGNGARAFVSSGAAPTLAGSCVAEAGFEPALFRVMSPAP